MMDTPSKGLCVETKIDKFLVTSITEDAANCSLGNSATETSSYCTWSNLGREIDTGKADTNILA